MSPDRKGFDALRDRMEAVRALKAEYGIGSQEAHRYLKIHSEYDALRHTVTRRLRAAGIQYKPTVREVANVCGEVRRLTEAQLREASETFLLPDDARTRPVDIEIAPARKTVIWNHENTMWEDPGLRGSGRSWKLDYESLLVHYFSTASRGNQSEALRATMDELMTSERPHLTDVRTGKSLSYQGIVTDRSIMRQECPKGEKMYTLADVFLPAAGIELPESAELSEDDIRDAILNASDDALRKLRAFRIGMEGMMDDPDINHSEVAAPDLSERPTYEEMSLLYGVNYDRDELYERALSEQNEHRIETERRIVLAAFMEAKHKGHPFPEMDDSDRIDGLLSDYRRTMQEHSARRVEIEALGESRMAKSFRKKEEKNRYFYLALLTNRRWLESFLGH